jgi:Uma2 family endonuclease
MQLLESPHLFTVEEYMALDIEARTELLGGVIYDVSPQNELHRYPVGKLNQSLSRGLGSEYIVRVQDAVAVSGWHGNDAPEIDVAVLVDRFYRPMPTAADALAFIEVSDATYTVDRKYKIPLYVNAGVPSYIANIPLRQVECYGSLQDLEAEHGRISTERDTLELEILGVAIPIAVLFNDGEGARDHGAAVERNRAN